MMDVLTGSVQLLLERRVQVAEGIRDQEQMCSCSPGVRWQHLVHWEWYMWGELPGLGVQLALEDGCELWGSLMHGFLQ